MAETQYSSESPHQQFYEEWDSRIDKDILDSSSIHKSFNESSLVIDNGTLYGTSKTLGKRRLISSLEDSENLIKEDNKEIIAHVNEMLKRNGFAVIKSSSHSAFLRLIEHLLNVIEEITYGINFASLDDIFKRNFGRGIEKGSKNDSAIVNLISVYEVQKRSYEQDIERLAKELNNKRRTIAQVEENMRQSYHKALNDMQEKLVMLEKRCTDLKLDKKSGGEHSDSNSIVEEVCRVLNIKQSSQIVPAVVKLEKVLRAVPSLEKFIKDVFYIVSSNENSEDKLTMENVIPTLKKSFKELHDLKYKKKPGHNKVNFYQEVIEHFKHLFEIDKDEDLIETMDQVFLFVHELRSFLKSVRVSLNLDEGVTVNGILVRIKNILESC